MAFTCDTPVNVKERPVSLAPSCRPSKRPCIIETEPSMKNLAIPSLNPLDNSDVEDKKVPSFLPSFRPRLSPYSSNGFSESPRSILCSGFLPIIPQDEQQKQIPSVDAFFSSALSKGEKEDQEPQDEELPTKKRASSIIFVVPLPRRLKRRPSMEHALCA